MWYSFAVGMLAAYFLGNLNGAVLMSAMMNDDVRSHGSGNAGLTNFVRNFGFGRALYVIFIDAGKAILSCLLVGLLLKPQDMFLEGLALGGAAAMLGHTFPILLGFRGGKGILSGLFVALTVDWRIGLIALGIFILAYGISRYVSLGSVLGAAGFCAGFAVFYWDNLLVMIPGVIAGLLAIFMHRGNIVRLCKGTERKTNLFQKKGGQ